MNITHSVWKAVIATISLGVVSLSAQAVTLCHDHGQQYPWVVKNGKGLNIVLLEMVGAATGEKLELTAMPWKTCLEAVAKGEFSGAFAASYSDERAKNMVYPMQESKLDHSRRLHIDGYTLLRLKGSNVAWDGRKLSNLVGPVGTQAGYSVAADLVKLGVKVDSNTDVPETLLRRFGSGQLQVIALLTGEAKHTMKKPYLADKVEIVSPALSEKPYFLVFSRSYYEKNRKVADGLWSAVAKTRESAEYKAIESAGPLSK